MRTWVSSCFVVVGIVLAGCVVAPAEGGDEGIRSEDRSRPDPPPPPLEPPSCRNLPKTCGFDRAQDCCISLDVPAATYLRSFDVAPDRAFSNTSFPATVSAFRLDKFEITVGRFRTFVRAGMGTQHFPPAAGDGAHANIVGSGWNPQFNGFLPANSFELNAGLHCDLATHLETWTDVPGPNENKPLSCLTWYEAMAFCIWDGGFLPTEAEWNDAATGGTEQRAFPWSAPPGDLTLDIDHAAFSDDVRCAGEGSPDCILVVGSLPAGDGRFGHSDLAGNVNEWVLDSFRNPYRLTPCVDCADLSSQLRRVFRGGSFGSFAGALRTASRTSQNPATTLFSFGARCARPALADP